MRRLLIAACVASFLVVGAYADINGRLLRNPNEYSFQITAGVSDEPEEITLAGTRRIRRCISAGSPANPAAAASPLRSPRLL